MKEIHIIVIVFLMGLVCLVQSMGTFGSSQLITFNNTSTPSSKCIVASPTGIIYMIMTNDNTTYWVMFDTSLNYTSKDISADVSGDAISSCKFYNNRIYVVGRGGYAAVIAPNGQVLAQRTGTEDFETFVFSSEVENAYASIFAWNSSNGAGAPVYYVNISNGTAEIKNLTGLAPLGGFAMGGFIYFYGNMGISKFADPNVTFVDKIDIPINTATFSPEQGLAFVFSENDQCSMNVTVISLDSLSVSSSFVLTTSNAMPSFCDWSKNPTTAFVANSTLYIYVVSNSNNTLYKIQNATIVDILSGSTNATSFTIDVMMTNAFAGYAERRVYKYSTGTCATAEYFNASAGACAACGAGSWPSAAYSAASCTACPAGTYWSSTGCQACPPGKFTNSSGMLECVKCNPGYISFSNAAVCEPCLAGSFQDGNKCNECPAGKASEKASSECTFCPPGTFSEQGSGECTSCAPGTSTNGTAGNKECYPCGDRFIAATAGQSECLKCDKNYYADKTGTKCLSCSKDKWNRSGECTPIGEIAILVPIVVLVGSGIAFVIWKTRRVGNNFKHYEMRDEVDPHDTRE